jgi:hypothetical protein
MADIFDQFDPTPRGDIFSQFEENKQDQAQQLGIGLAEGGIGTAGSILDFLKINPQASLTPAQEIQAQREAEGSEQDLTLPSDDDLLQGGTGRLPSQDDIESLLDILGINTQAQTPGGEATRQGGRAAGTGLSLGAGPLGAILGLTGGSTGETIRQQGGNEGLALLADIGISGADIVRSGLRTLLSKKPVKGALGLSKRQFENLKKPVKVTKGTESRAVEGIKKEFSEITEDLQSVTNKSLKSFREEPGFEGAVNEGFEALKKSGADIDHIVPESTYKKNLSKQYGKIKKQGFESSESEEKLAELLQDAFKKSPSEDQTFNTLVEQFRKNNRESKKYYGPNAIENEAKKEALAIKNRAIADTIEEEFGHLPESKLFKDLNKSFNEIQKIKTVDRWVESVFPEGKIDFRRAKKALEGGKTARNLENAIGKESFDKFKTLTSDLLDKQEAIKLLKTKNLSVEDLGKAGLAFLIKPAFAYARQGKDIIAQMWRRGLGDPEFARDWSKALDLFKDGKVQQAIAISERLYQEAQGDAED